MSDNLKEEQILANHDWNDDRTSAFITSKYKRQSDSIAWMIWGLSILFFTIFSLGRITIIGQFFDDVIFNFIFGWSKYVIYLLLFFVDICIFVGVRFKFKKRFLLMVIAWFLLLSWLISLVFYAYLLSQGAGILHGLWQKDILAALFQQYLLNWEKASIFAHAYFQAPIDYFLKSDVRGYFNLFSGGGVLGTALTGVFAYTSIIGAFVIWCFSLLLNSLWIFTGDAFYLFKPKTKRKGRALRILSLNARRNPNTRKQLPQTNLAVKEPLITHHTPTWDSINVFGREQANISDDIKTSDLTIKMPSYFKNEERILLDNLERQKEIAALENSALDNDAPLDAPPNKPHHQFVSRRQIPTQKPKYHHIPQTSIVPKGKPQLPVINNQTSDITTDPALTLYEQETTKLTSISDEDFLNVTPGLASDSKESQYQLPPLNILHKPHKNHTQNQSVKDVALAKSLAIDETFKQFGIKARVINTILGPSVMKFEIQTSPGTKVNSITTLENDLRLALATNNIRLETPIPGKTLIGIEIANPHPEIVSMREIIESINESHQTEKLLFVLGKNVLGQPLTAQLNKMPHLLIAGSTGSGKSVMINTIICSILLRAKPNEVKFLMIDPKRVELSLYSKIPHMLAPVISDMHLAATQLKVIVSEMESRYEQFLTLGVRNIDGYNKKMPPDQKMPYHVVIIDELADLMMTGDRKMVEEAIMRITQMARAAGIHLIVATQRPSVDVITGTIKTNIPTRIAFSVRTGVDSRTILDAIGAETLLGRGDMLFMPPNGGDLMRAQGAFMSDEEIEKIVNFVTNQATTNYDNRFYNEINKPKKESHE